MGVEKAFEVACQDEDDDTETKFRSSLPDEAFINEDNEHRSKGKEDFHLRIEELCQKIEEREEEVRKKREELRNLEIESEVEVFEMKQEILSLQAHLDDTGDEDG